MKLTEPVKKYLGQILLQNLTVVVVVVVVVVILLLIIIIIMVTSITLNLHLQYFNVK